MSNLLELSRTSRTEYEHFHYFKTRAFRRLTLNDSQQVPELVAQRRRWLNGSFFAAIFSIVHFGYIYRSS